jgi:ribosome-binding protein aMBF1 (putative translation factor)
VDTLQEKIEKSFPERIKEARKHLGLSQSALARKWGFPKQTICAWESGFRTPHGLYREKLERLLKRSSSRTYDGTSETCRSI